MSNNSSPSRLSRHGSQKSSSSSSRSPRERKEFLRAVLTKTQTLHDCTAQTVFNLEEMFKEADVINQEATMDDNVSCQDEFLIDSRFMSTSSKLLKAGTLSLTKELSPYDSREFAEKLKNYVHMLPDTTMNKPNWSILEDEVTKMFKRTPNFSALSGFLEPLEKTAIVKRQPLKKDPLAPTSRPEAIKNIAKDENSIEATVQKIFKLIKHHCKETGKPLDFFSLILHPTDFGKTIENMLHVSFLVRDGRLKMTMDENEDLVVLLTTKEMRAQAEKSGKARNVQNVISLNVDQWKTLVDAYNITTPMISF